MSPVRCAVVALGLSIGIAPAAPGVGHIAMYYNPAPVVGETETIDLTLPVALAGGSVIVYSLHADPPCSNPLDCDEQFTPTSLGPVTSFTYTPGPGQAQSPISFFFLAVKGGQIAVTDMGVVTASASNPLPPDTQHPIMFVTQVPFSADFANVASPFGSHRARPIDAPRGGDLFIRYPDGLLKNLTKLAGYGNTGLQGAKSIAVRDPTVHWGGAKAIFSMVVGAPGQNGQNPYYWQLYEVTGLGVNDTPVITKVPGQPPNFNNVSPCYGSDGRVIFTSDQPRSGELHLYPQTDEYEATPTVTGVWSIDPYTGDVALLQHSPSGSFKPIVDSFGRIVFTRWDHLQRDLQKDEDIISAYGGGNAPFQTFNYANESATAAIGPNLEYFPEATNHFVYFVNNNPGYAGDMNGWVPNLLGNEFNRFMPWTINQDGSAEETLGHIGRHELQSLIAPAFNGGGLVYYLLANSPVVNANPIDHMMQVRESPLVPGTYVGVNAPEFFTHASGQLVKLAGQPNLNADQMLVTYLTQNATGHYRNPVILTSGQFVSVHTPVTANDDYQQPQSQYDFRIKTLKQVGSFWQPDVRLTYGISKSVQWWTPFQLASYSGELWELDPVEVVARPVPPITSPVLPAPEAAALAAAHVNKADLVQYLKDNSLALIVMRNVTTRDRNDRQQAFNLRVFGTSTQTVATGDPISVIKYLQLFQADQVRGMYKNNPTPVAGRRVIAVPMHEPQAILPPLPPAAPVGSVAIGADGSVAALVPARRAMTWQLTNAVGKPIVRERYWLTFQPGEIRSCTSCHGLNTADQIGNPPPTNTPLALEDLLIYLKSIGELTSNTPGTVQIADVAVP